MARITAPAKVLGAIAWLDQAELDACRRFNRTVRTAGLLKVFQIASRLGDGVLWYALIATLALFYGSEGRLVALQCVAAGVSGLVVYRLLKNVLVRERPYMTHAAIVWPAAARSLQLSLRSYTACGEFHGDRLQRLPMLRTGAGARGRW